MALRAVLTLHIVAPPKIFMAQCHVTPSGRFHNLLCSKYQSTLWLVYLTLPMSCMWHPELAPELRGTPTQISTSTKRFFYREKLTEFR
jgi:hypothetical protein